MAAADYYLCDRCGAKAFYDATLWGHSSNADGPYAGVGKMVVLCKQCAETHDVSIASRQPKEAGR